MPEKGLAAPGSVTVVAARESERQRVNRELLELLGELRVALPGVQVLFAFLLAVPFQARFADATTFQRDAYFVTLVLSALASVLLIAPSALTASTSVPPTSGASSSSRTRSPSGGCSCSHLR